MGNTLMQYSWRSWAVRALLVGMVAGVSSANAQSEPKPNLGGNVIEYLSYDKLAENRKALVISAINSYDVGEYHRSIEALTHLLRGEGLKKPPRPLRAWSNQWLAMNYSALENVAEAQRHAKLSLEEDVEIWREYSEPRMDLALRELYLESWDRLRHSFEEKRNGLRLGLGTIPRVDYSYRSRLFEVLAGLGYIPLDVDIQGQKFTFKKVLLYARIQRMRNNLERLNPGLYFEPAIFLVNDNTDKKLEIGGALSFGAVMAYTYKSGWEFGGSFQIAQLLLGENAQQLPSNLSIESENLRLTIFELYLRKWF